MLLKKRYATLYHVHIGHHIPHFCLYHVFSMSAGYHIKYSVVFLIPMPMVLTDLGCPSISYHSLLDDPGLPTRINHGL